MYHLELRQFPHVARRFNQSEQDVLALAKPWVGEAWIEEAERKWNINEATLTILEGPKLTMADLAMGRGWRNAQRRSEDVTERVLATFRKDNGGGGASAHGGGDGTSAVNGAASSPDPALLADSLGLELLGLLDDRPLAPAHVWRLAHERLPQRPLAEALAVADGAVRSLLRRGLVVLKAGDVEAPGGDRGEALGSEQVETALGAIETWADGAQHPVAIVRKR